MMGWFRRNRSATNTNVAIRVMEDVINQAAAKWVYFSETIPFETTVPLADRIQHFMVPFEQGLREHVPELRDAPAAVILLFVAKGVERSGTHSSQEIEDALGVPLPD